MPGVLSHVVRWSAPSATSRSARTYSCTLVHGTDLRVIGDAVLAAGLPVWS